MLSLIFSKAKIIGAALLAALVPTLYLLGRKAGKDAVEKEVLEDEVSSLKRQQEFQEEMREHEQKAEDNKPRSRGDLIDRLRNNGL